MYKILMNYLLQLAILTTPMTKQNKTMNISIYNFLELPTGRGRGKNEREIFIYTEYSYTLNLYLNVNIF